ncbi:S8 family serine peptidase [Pontibacter sp. JH31]|uniref:S8 family serine peptidase n=1 Tax=Pontibacter aquaedesilientis TaxID=2766980 RepID=A0ABR7XEK1_9BACT|nr:S8 family serine peptidase [Pontibacter aquaedesilientis]MBD1396043.1 S8 family serine peptidase [Pontibacter aquaedesilientis]
MRFLLFSICFLLIIPVAKGQAGSSTEEQKHLVYFTDKAQSPYSINSPEQYLSPKALARRSRQHIPVTPRDFPVNPAYVADLKKTGVTLLYTSRWFNAAVVQCSTEKLAELQTLPFVRSSRSLNRLANPAGKSGTLSIDSMTLASTYVEAKLYGSAFHQANMLGVPALHDEGFRGEGMAIAVFDAGFPGVNSVSAFAHLFQNGQVKATFDFVKKSPQVYANNAHGTAVLSTMAAYEPGLMIGTAYKADYLLFGTEDAATEHNIEEVNWLLAAEYADSAGADIINSSLGYTAFDPPSTSYTYPDLNGNTTIVTRAADYAAATGMLVVVSAGNEGNKPWRYISAPADADSVLTVGAVDSLANHASFSSYGPTADKRVKPDVVAMGQQVYVVSSSGRLSRSSGTSFSGPIMAGMVACLWQANADLTNMQLLERVRQLGSHAANPNFTIGYGVPSYARNVTSIPKHFQDGITITNPMTDRELVITMGESWQKESAVAHVYDTTGKLLLKQGLPAHQKTHTLSLKPGRLKRGVYLCQISSDSQNVTLRFIKL